MNDNGTRTDSASRGCPTVRQMMGIVKRFIDPSDRSDAEHDFVKVFQKCRDDLLSFFSVDVKQTKVLVLGCGYHYPDVALWSSIAAHAVGVDVRQVFWRNGQGMLYDSIHRSGRGRLRSLMESIYKRRGYPSYYRRLRKLSGLNLDFEDQDLVAYDGTRLPFAGGTFDIVCSNAVLEHVSDLGGVAKELNRVTKENGLNYHLWHNYYALSGGHVRAHLARSHPWGHLLGDHEVERYLQLSGTFLNKLRPEEIVEILSESFDPLSVVQVDAEHRKKDSDSGFRYEGEDLLTPEIEKELSKYPRETLLTRGYLFIGRK